VKISSEEVVFVRRAIRGTNAEITFVAPVLDANFEVFECKKPVIAVEGGSCKRYFTESFDFMMTILTDSDSFEAD
jgi:hypothetical protein